MISGITKHHKYTTTTHSYKGFTSICGDEDITHPSPESYSVRSRVEASHCKVCLEMLKSEKIHKMMQKRMEALGRAQEKAKKYGVTLQSMLLTRLKVEVNMSAEISDLKKTFNEEYPGIDIEDIIVPMLIEGKVIIENEIISLPMETNYGQ